MSMLLDLFQMGATPAIIWIIMGVVASAQGIAMNGVCRVNPLGTFRQLVVVLDIRSPNPNEVIQFMFQLVLHRKGVGN